SSKQKTYHVADVQDTMVVELKFSDNGVNFIMRFTFKRGLYDLVMTYVVDNQSAQPWSGNLYAQLKRDASSDPSSTTA
ncbi:YidC/Oxa1 family insertase periplasmic-domain containing protein, partial [Pseudomonas syringae group genomosp. 7]|uniref:YidC/Oxa1 family insertase periplasmic-domain containing protein n=1 Tax=Pseudomonas syringae group genomosp. 7 TaxID=251699 RepID=UPI00377069DF